MIFDEIIIALNAQGNKLIDLLEQDKSLQNSLDECEKAISSQQLLFQTGHEYPDRNAYGCKRYGNRR